MIGKLGGSGLGALISGWRVSLRRSVAEMWDVLKKEGIRGGLGEIISGRSETFGSIARKGELDRLPNTKRPGPNIYLATDFQLSKAMKADFNITYLEPGSTEAKTYTRSMLYNRDRTKGALLSEFDRRLQEDIQSSSVESDLAGITVLQIDLLGLFQRTDVDYEWEPDDAPW